MRWSDWNIDENEEMELWKQILICAIRSGPINISFPELEGIGKDFLEGRCFKAVLWIDDTVSELFLSDEDKVNNIRRILFELKSHNDFIERAERQIKSHGAAKKTPKTAKTQKNKEEAYKQYMNTFHRDYTLASVYQMEKGAFYAGWLMANGYQFEIQETGRVYEKDGALDISDDPYEEEPVDPYEDDEKEEDWQEQERHYHKRDEGRTPPDIDWEE